MIPDGKDWLSPPSSPWLHWRMIMDLTKKVGKGFSCDSIAVIAAKASNLRADAAKLSSSKLSYKFAHPPNGLVELRLGCGVGETQIPFAVRSKVRSRKAGYSGFIEQAVG